MANQIIQNSKLKTQNLNTLARRKIRFDVALTGVLGLALLMRLLVWLTAPHPNFVIDEAEYYQIASILTDGRGWFFYEAATWVRPPLYIMLLAGIFKLFGANLIIVRLVQLFISLASVYLLYRLGCRLYGRKCGLVAGVLAAIAWPFATFPFLLLSETLFILLFLAAITCLVEFLALANDKPRNNFLPGSRREWLWLVAGGFSLGLAALTRGQVVSFVPFLALWLLIALKGRWKKALGAFLLVCLIFGATVSPWLIRNAATYGRPFIDTTGGHNFYLGALKGRNGAQVSQQLEAIKNHAERESLGYQKGLEIMWADIPGFIGKGIKETLDFWQINFGAEERLQEGFTKGQINPLWLIFNAIFDDLLYVIVGTLAMLGLVVAPATKFGGRAFVAIWTIQNMLLAFAFFAVTRFRLSVYFFLLLFAAYTLTHWGEVRAWFGRGYKSSAGGRDYKSLLRKSGRWAYGLALPVLFLAVVLPSYSPVSAIFNSNGKSWADNQPTLIGIKSWFDQQPTLRGDALRMAGDFNGALAEYAKADQNVPATQIGIGLTEAELGKYDDAIGRIGRTSQDIAASHLALGYIYLKQANLDYARREFNIRQVALDPHADEWAWQNFLVKPLPKNELLLNGLDWGYVHGFHVQESLNGKTFRWTGTRGDDGQGRSLLRFPAAGKPTRLQIELNGLRPDPLTPPVVQIYANGRFLGNIQTERSWKTYSLNLPPDLPPDIIIEIAVPTFVPGADSRRELGVMVASARLE